MSINVSPIIKLLPFLFPACIASGVFVITYCLAHVSHALTHNNRALAIRWSTAPVVIGTLLLFGWWMPSDFSLPVLGLAGVSALLSGVVALVCFAAALQTLAWTRALALIGILSSWVLLHFFALVTFFILAYAESHTHVYTRPDYMAMFGLAFLVLLINTLGVILMLRFWVISKRKAF